MPVAVPPVRGSLSAGGAPRPATPSMEVEAADAPVAVQGAPPFLHGRLGVTPLSLVPSLADRSYDGEVGLVIDRFVKDDETILGGYLSGTYFPLVGGDRDLLGRIGLGLTLEALDRQDDAGFGASLHTEIGFTHFVDGDISSTGGVGHGYGEIGLSFVANVGMREFGGFRYMIATCGLAFRLPGGAGFAWLW